MKINLDKSAAAIKFDKQLPVFNIFYPSKSDEIDGEIRVDTTEAISRLNLSSHRSVALYCQFPFCETICNFCPFTRGKYQDHDIISQYLKGLEREIVVKARRQNLKTLNVRSIFVGGGTPSLLSADEIFCFGRILQDNFNLTNLLEFSFECEVKSVTDDKVKALRDIGVTNARFGLQTFDPYWRHMFDLTATLSKVYNAANLLQKAIRQTSFDILYAMNGHDIAQFESDLKKAAEIGNNLFDVYPIDDVVTQIRLHQKTKQAGLAPPSASSRFEMNDFLRESMRDKGFLPHNGHGYVRSSSKEIADNPIVTRGYRFEYHDHVYGYRDHIVVGFGVNAISLLQGCVLTNTNNRNEYIAALTSGETVAGQISFHGADIAASRPLVTRLAYHGFIEKAKVDFTLAPPETILALRDLSDANLIEESEDEMLLTKDGWRWYVNIMYYCMPLSQRKLLNAFLIHKLSQNGREVRKEQVVFARNIHQTPGLLVEMRTYHSKYSKNCRKLVLSQTLSAFGMRGFDVALVWLAVTELESLTGVGLVLFFKFMPYPVFGLLGGWLGDLLPRHRIIAASDLLRGVLLLIAAWIVTRSSDVWTLGVIAFLFTTFRTASQPANQGLLPDLVEDSQLGRANSILHGFTEIAQTLAPMVMAMLMKVVQPWESLVFLASIFVSATFLVPKPEASVVAYCSDGVLSNRAVLRSYARTIGKLRNSRPDVLGAMLIIPIAILGGGGMVNLSLPELLIGGQNAQLNHYGFVVAALSFGTLSGAYIVATLPGKYLSLNLYTSWLAYGVLIYVLSLQTEVAQLIIYATLAGAVGAIADISLTTLLQQGATKSEVSKTFAIFSTLANGSEALSAPMMGLVVAYLSIRYSFLIGSLIIAAASVSGLFLLYRLKMPLDIR